nr:hypothetical protein [Tanacetum cinerariifolium]
MDVFQLTRFLVPPPFLGVPAKRVKNEPRLLESTVWRVVPLLPIAPARASIELEASVDKLFDEGASGNGQGTDIQPVTATIDTIAEDKLREDYGALGGAFTAAKGEPIPTLPFITSSVSATPEREDKSHADFVTELNLRTIGAPQRFVISSDSSHHFGAKIVEAEVDSIVRSSAPAIVTTQEFPFNKLAVSV